MNYKIRVKNETESKEVQELFVVLGYMVVNNIDCEKGYIVVSKNAESPINFDYWHDVKNIITIQQLRDLVVLKRNDISDATHENSHGQSLLKVSNGWYIFNTLLDVWEWNGEYLGYQPIKLKPITKEPVMKEYLNKLEDGTYKLVVLDSVADGVEGLIEIPEGAFAMSRGIGFYKMRGDEIMVKHPDAAWRKSAYEKISTIKGLAWQRETLNDKIASAEVARQDFIRDLPAFNFGAVDDFVESNVEQGAKHSHYKKDISHLDTLDIYRVTELFNPHSCGAHIAKKALCSGQRGHKDLLTDIQDIIDTAERWKEMLIEDEKAK